MIGGPTDSGMTFYQENQQTLRDKSLEHTQVGNLLYNGHSNYRQTYYSDKIQEVKKRQQEAIILGQMRHCYKVEKNNKEAMDKQKDVENCQAEEDRRHESEDVWRTTALRDMATSNLKMHH